MKIKYIINILLSLAALSACSRESEPAAPSRELVEWIFNAPATKASFDSKGRFSWEVGDVIAVWNESNGSFVNFTTATEKGIFYAKAPADARFTGSAFYPVSIAVSPSEVKLSGESRLMRAAVEEESNMLSFKHICAYVSISLRNIQEENAKLQIVSDSTLFSGNFTLEEGVWTPTGSAGSLEFAVEGNAIQVTVPVPVGTYPLSYRILDADGAVVFQRSTDGDFNFGRAFAYSFPAENLAPATDPSLLTVDLEGIDIEEDNDNWE